MYIVDLLVGTQNSSKTKHEADVSATLSGKQRVAMKDQSCLGILPIPSEHVLPIT